MEIEFKDGATLKKLLSLIQLDDTDDIYFHCHRNSFTLAWQAADNQGKAVIDVKKELLSSYMNFKQEQRIVKGEFN
jgi:hypothetical protein